MADFWSDFTGGAAHTGSWFGLPDFGLTEGAQGKVSTSPSPTGLTNDLGVPTTLPEFQVNTTPTNLTPLYNQQSTTSGGNTGGTTGGTTGGVLGTTTTTSGDTGGTGTQSYEDQMRSSINSGWDSYINQLNSMLDVDLPAYRTQQEGIAQTSADLATQQLGTQRGSSERAVREGQASNLKDLAENVRNLFQSGNVYLGARGAGDSSAANQYSYAIGKLGTKARGDVLSQAQSRLSQINDIFNTESNRLMSELNTRKGQIADWFYTTQQNLKQSLAGAGLNREKDLQALSTQLYNQALSYLQSAQAEAANRRSVLETWAANNSKNAQELTQNMRSIQQMPQFQGITSGMPQVTAEGNMYVPAGYGGRTNEKDIFGNTIG